MISLNRTSRGMTLMEVQIGITILMVVAVPLLLLYMKITHSSTNHDSRVAYALLQGETAIINKKNVVSESERTIKIDGIDFYLSCGIKNRDGDLVSWFMKVRKGEKKVAQIHGYLYSPAAK